MYFVVKRTINSATKYYVECFNDDNTTDSATLLSGSSLPNASTITKTVTVQNVSGNKYFIDGTQQPTLNLYEGHTYKFDQSDGSNSGHPLRFYLDANKTTAYTTGVNYQWNSRIFWGLYSNSSSKWSSHTTLSMFSSCCYGWCS